ncbi:MAG: queuosine precursor transporter [Alphaproteobacteria bacterium]|nr:queuosine precursor transporter [Alphaproteobacteria bacterium]
MKIKNYLYMIYISALIISNITANRIGVIGYLNVAGNPLAYILCFFICDLINEKFGEKAAKEVVNFGFISLCTILILLYSTYLIPALDSNFDNGFKLVFNNSARVVIASLCAYLISNHIDIKIFNFIRKRNNSRLLRKIGSTIISQFVDSLIFGLIAFYLIIPFNELKVIIISEYLVKFFINLIDTPLYYICIKKKNKSTKD